MQSCHSWTQHSMLTCSINLPSIIKLFQMVTELCSENKNEVKKYGSGDILRKQIYAELSFLYTPCWPVL